MEKDSPFQAVPTYNFETNGTKIYNYGKEYFFPNPDLIENLEELFIFSEGNVKYNIPIGSVWVYPENSNYNPQILKSDVGCGMTVFLTEEIEANETFANDLLKILFEENIQIGRGNHFISIAEGHPSAKMGNIVVLHSDINPLKLVPKTYTAAIEREDEARYQRIEILTKILNRLGISAKFYNDWTHNSVEKIDGKIIYRKGAIDTKKTEIEGLMALNPYDGFYFYLSKWERTYHSFQHGPGIIAEEKADFSLHKTIKKGKNYIQLIDKTKKPKNLYKHYKDPRLIQKQFIFGLWPLGYSRSIANIYTS